MRICLIESCALVSTMSKSSSLMGGKRRRGAEDEVFFDNYHTHKRYLTEVMASSMIGLSVGESGISRRPSPPLVDAMLSPETGCPGVSRSASSFPSHGDETSTLDSPMSEDSDESVGYRLSRGSDAQYPISSASELALTNPPSPCSLRRFQRYPCHASGHLAPGSLAWTPSRLPAAPGTPAAWPRCPDSEGRLPPSPNDPCQSADLRRATLLRNLQMRAQLPAQPTSSATTPDKTTDKIVEEQESVEEGGDQSSPNSMSCQYYDYGSEQVGCSRSVLGSPTHGVYAGQAARGSLRARSLLLGDNTDTRPKAVMTTEEVSNSNEADEEMNKLDQPLRFDEDRTYSRRPRSPRSPKAGYEISSSLSPKDGNISDTESTFTRRSGNRTSLSRNPSVCSRAETGFSAMEATQPF